MSKYMYKSRYHIVLRLKFNLESDDTSPTSRYPNHSKWRKLLVFYFFTQNKLVNGKTFLKTSYFPSTFRYLEIKHG